jgi:osmotically inducible protein OsmC
MATIKRSAFAEWSGDLKGGEGEITAESKVLNAEGYSFGTRFQQKPGTNPEELIAAAHAACYSMAFAHTLAEKGYQPERVTTTATCFLEALDEGGFVITDMHLEVRGEVPNLDEATFQEIAQEADEGCPVSNLLREGLNIEINAQLM